MEPPAKHARGGSDHSQLIKFSTRACAAAPLTSNAKQKKRGTSSFRSCVLKPAFFSTAVSIFVHKPVPPN